MIIQICVGSSCYLKGSAEIVKLLEEKVSNGYSDKITLAGSFCLGKCNRIGVTVKVGDEIYTGITPTNFENFWVDKIEKKFT
ncbi:MAG TPA: hypothetical protein DDY82_04100 [Clostridiales bacterium]|nr:hypothetical protein [Clostridiales bacterium]HBJ98231.1 hypothetical protein [Clostridiales bacterium]